MALENPQVLADFPIKTPVRGFSNHLWFPAGMWSDFPGVAHDMLFAQSKIESKVRMSVVEKIPCIQQVSRE